MTKINVSKKPNLLVTTPTNNTYKGLSQSELLDKVRSLHEQILKTNKYLLDVHRISIYNWDINDTGNIIVEIPEGNKGFLLDSILRLRGYWDPKTNEPELMATDTSKAGWLYKVATESVTRKFGISWKTGDYALYDENGVLHNVIGDMLAGLFTPIVPIESDTIIIDPIEQDASGILLRAHVKLDPSASNDLQASAKGLMSDAYQKAKGLITVQETEPTADNLEGGLRIVYLPYVPEQMYGGYLYLVPPTTTIIDEG